MNYSDNPPKILVVKTHAIGDLLMVTPSLRALKKKFPSADIDLMTGSWSSGAVKHNPYINTIIEVPDEVFHGKKLFRLTKLIKRLRHNKYDMAFVFQPSRIVQILIRMAGIKHLAAPVRHLPSKLVRYPVLWRSIPDDYVVKDFISVVKAVNIDSDGLDMDFFIPEGIQQQVQRMLFEDSLGKHQYLVVCPGGGRNPRDYVKQKIWPEDRYAELIKRLLDEGVPVIVAGSQSDRETCRNVLRIPGIVDLMGKTTFAQLGAFIQSARLLLTNDSAPMHLALAVHCPFVAVFGPSCRKSLLPESGNFEAITPSIACAPCYNNEPFGRCDRCDCIQSVQTDTVYKAVIRSWKR